MCLAIAIPVFAQAGRPVPAQAEPPYTPGLDVSAMDKTVDPCVDFYTYSCGGWMKNNPIPPDQYNWSAYSKLQDENRLILRDILEKASIPDAKRSSVQQKIGDYYASCMDEKAIESSGAKPLEAELKTIAGLRSKDQLPEFLADFHRGDEHTDGPTATLFSFGSGQDFKDSTQYIAQADQGGLGLPDRDFYLKEDAKSVEIRNAYVAHVTKMLQLIGEGPQEAASDAQVILKIETELAKASLTRVERRDPNNIYHKMGVAELQALAPSFSWPRYFTQVGLGQTNSLNVTHPPFFKQMEAELNTVSLAQWQTYLRWHLVHSRAPYLSSPFVNENFDFYGRTLTGAKELRPRWKRCVSWVDRDLGEALGQAYVERTFSAEAKQRTLRMVQEIEKAMDDDVKSLDWMQPATKQQALTKLHAVANKIGYPDKWRDYSALNIVRGDAPGNVQRGIAFEFRRQLGKIGKPVDHTEWDMTPPTVNAYYNPQMNDINFPAGVLQPPLFDPRMDDAPNYGNTGGTIGHELTHGFDDEGRQFDAQGNLRDWWTAQDSKAFEQRAGCIVDQYAQYTIVDDIKINSKLTEGEDVADLGGLLLAWMAWKDHTRNMKLQPIDGLTPEQRFFIGYGQSWCTNERDEIKRLRATIDPHSPAKYRTNGVVSNMPEFREAFRCKPGQPMVREKACRVW
ncbi:MAG: M13 family metallopeptidase [Acidobacteriia bacterium]|nr:M13 family metallopeptidase [Terriglobia bacterium]